MTPPDRDGDHRPGPAARGSWALRDRPGLVWLGLAVLLALVHPFVPAASWLLVHLVLLGALTHSAMVWSTHFAQALLKTPTTLDDRTQQNRRIGLLVAGQAAVLVGVPASLWPLTVVGATAVSVAIGVARHPAVATASAGAARPLPRHHPLLPRRSGLRSPWVPRSVRGSPVASTTRRTDASSSRTRWSWCSAGSASP